MCIFFGYYNRVIYDVDWSRSNGLIVLVCGDDCIRVFREEEILDKN